MNPFLSLLLGPLGQAFSLMEEYQFLPSPEVFMEFTEEMYDAYYSKMGMPAERLYQMRPGNNQVEGSEILSISKTEMEEMLKAREFIEKTIAKNPENKNASDLDKLRYFKSLYPFLFTNSKQEDQ